MLLFTWTFMQLNLLVKGAKDLKFADFESAQTYMKGLVDKKVGVYACPTCLKIAGFKPEDLMEGVQVAQKDKFFNFTKGRITHIGLLESLWQTAWIPLYI